MKAVVILFALVALIYARTMTGDCLYRSPFLRNGAVTCKVTYDWAGPGGVGFIRVDYPTQNYYEIQQYNAMNGYGGGNTAFKDQWDYRVGQTCGCEVGSLDHVMPILAYSAGSTEAGYLTGTGFVHTTQGGNDVYTLSADPNAAAAVSGLDNYVTQYVFSGSNIVSITYDDESTFTFSNVQLDVAIPDSTYAYPTDCSCGRPIDIGFVVDRSGSIDALEWRDQKGFLVNFTKQFEYGPLAANIAIVHFNHIFWVSMTLAEGSSQANVYAGVNSLSCCDPDADNWAANPTISCCCCGTSISGGMHWGAEQLALSTRPIATKVILTLTDGFHNTQEDGASCAAFPTPYPPPPDPNGTACKGDLYNTVVNLVEPLVPNVVMYAIGVGTDRTFSVDELVVCAQNHPERVLTVTAFTDLYTTTLELVARTCDESSSPCGAGCCGFCTCGNCGPVDKCDQPADLCQTSSVPAGGSCCANTPVVCPANTLCATYACDSSIGPPCNGTPVPVPANTLCISWDCDPVKGVFSTPTPATCPPGPPPPECAKASDCNDGNLCTNDSCDTSLASAKCKWTQVDCSVQFPTDQCSQVQCDVHAGCSRTVYPASRCDDNNNCTIDSCDLQKGCVHVDVMTLPPITTNTGAIVPDPRTCSDGDPCTQDLCHPTLGCIFAPLICNASAAQVAAQTGKPISSIDVNCIIGFCANGTCGTRELDCPAAVSTTTIIGASLGTAALVGIIIAAIIAFAACAGGGAYAYSQAAGGSGVHVTANNPIYQGNANAGVNPLYAN